MFDARIRRRNQLRKMVGNARAKLSAILKEEAKALGRAARESLRGDIRRLEAEEEQRRQDVFRRRLGRDGAMGEGSRDVEMEEARGRMEDRDGGSWHRDMRVEVGSQRGVHDRSPHPGVGHQDVRVVQDGSSRRDGARGNPSDPRIRRMREQERREQETVEEVRRIREDRWNGGRRTGGLQQQDRQHGSIQQDQPGPSGLQHRDLQRRGGPQDNHQLVGHQQTHQQRHHHHPHHLVGHQQTHQVGRTQQQRASTNNQRGVQHPGQQQQHQPGQQQHHQQGVQLQQHQGARNQVLQPEVQCRLPAIR